MRLLIGIDDTDNLESRGTGYRARCLGELLDRADLAKVEGITRHQLLVDPKIPYTSHNSSACLSVSAQDNNCDDLIECCRSFLLKESAHGSDAGLSVAFAGDLSQDVIEFGRLAKREVLKRRAAEDLARRSGIVLEGLTGDHGGVIGALAAVGLRAGGGDGRFIWLEGIRELTGKYSASWLIGNTPVGEIRRLNGEPVDKNDEIDVGLWPRPILQNGKAVFLVEEEDEPNKWRLASKETIKERSG